MRTSYVFTPEKYAYRNIEGDFRGWFVRTDLELAKIGGALDVINEYGDTKVTVDSPLPALAHRLVTHGGHITLEANEQALWKLPVLAVSECGTVRLGFNDRSFEDVSWYGSTFHDELRGWQGFERQLPDEKRDPFPGRFERVSQALSGEDRSPGLDLISRGGSVQVLRLE